MIRRVRQHLYRLGYRPRPGTIFYSPTLEMLYQMRAVAKAVQEGVEQSRKDAAP